MVEGRKLHLTIDVWLSPPSQEKVGSTSPAWEIGRGLLKESIGMLRNTLEAEGFEVNIDTQMVIY
jgi:hypothetical protein